jgi:glucose/arabinose dehydrogenase
LPFEGWDSYSMAVVNKTPVFLTWSVLPNGDVLVAESANSGSARDTLMSPEDLAARWASGNRGHSANRITLLRDRNGDGTPEFRSILLSGLNRPVGMLFLDGWLYVANSDELVRYAFQPGDTTIITPPRRVLELPGGGYNNHWTRNGRESRGDQALRHGRIGHQRGHRGD